MNQSRCQTKQLNHTFLRFSFLILMQHLSVSHGLSTLDGKENDDGDFEKTKI